MNRRSVLRWLGLAPVAAPAVVAAAGQAEPVAPALLPRRFTGMFLETLPDGSTRIVFDANLIAFSANGGHTHPFSSDGETFRVSSSVVPRAVG
ncbi:hypothetical protein [Methylorubrum extorquens]|uniref:hypothetical protein n=1 Tax=Methylorubrum extorquens TaxID=408 RepID=UPI002238C820|nr:hypothetical protein [Methylorubrum extorquens]UYW32525.1 hypothetical protein OKB92_26775 [Methylorubrum extorquens]